jgi:hypothetical protein
MTKFPIPIYSFMIVSGEDKVSFQIKPFGLFGPGPRQNVPKPVSPPKQEMEGMEEEAKQKVCNSFMLRKYLIAFVIIRPSYGNLLCHLVKASFNLRTSFECSITQGSHHSGNNGKVGEIDLGSWNHGISAYFWIVSGKFG